MPIRYPRLTDVSYNFRYHMEECRRLHSIEYLEGRKAKLEALVLTGAELVNVDRQGNVVDTTEEVINKELKGIKKQISYLKRKGK